LSCYCYKHGNIIMVSGHRSFKPETEQKADIADHQFWNTWQCKFTIEGQIDLLIMAIKDGKAVVVSDGSFKEQHTAQQLGQLKGQQCQPASMEQALLQVLQVIKACTAANCLACGGPLLHSNGCVIPPGWRRSFYSMWQSLSTEEGIQCLSHWPWWSPLWPHQCHQKTRKSLPVNIQFKHLKGHQDNRKPTALTQLAWLNINMDIQAKGKLQSLGPTQLIHNIPFEQWTCTIKGQRIIKNITTSLQHHLNGTIILNHWATRNASHLKFQRRLTGNWWSRQWTASPCPTGNGFLN